MGSGVREARAPEKMGLGSPENLAGSLQEGGSSTNFASLLALELCG